MQHFNQDSNSDTNENNTLTSEFAHCTEDPVL